METEPGNPRDHPGRDPRTRNATTCRERARDRLPALVFATTGVFCRAAPRCCRSAGTAAPAPPRLGPEAQALGARIGELRRRLNTVTACPDSRCARGITDEIDVWRANPEVRSVLRKVMASDKPAPKRHGVAQRGAQHLERLADHRGLHPRPLPHELAFSSFSGVSPRTSTRPSTGEMMWTTTLAWVRGVVQGGGARPKVFKLRRITLGPRASASFEGRVSFAPMTTRRHYPGVHRLEARVNGEAFPLGEVELMA